jgi:hypothetical protein
VKQEIQVPHGDRVHVIFDMTFQPGAIHRHGFEDRIGHYAMPRASKKPVQPSETSIPLFEIRN